MIYRHIWNILGILFSDTVTWYRIYQHFCSQIKFLLNLCLRHMGVRVTSVFGFLEIDIEKVAFISVYAQKCLGLRYLSVN